MKTVKTEFGNKLIDFKKNIVCHNLASESTDLKKTLEKNNISFTSEKMVSVGTWTGGVAEEIEYNTNIGKRFAYIIYHQNGDSCAEESIISCDKLTEGEVTQAFELLKNAEIQK